MEGHSSLQMIGGTSKRTAKHSGSLVNFEILLVGPCYYPRFAPHGVVMNQGDRG